MTDLPIRSEKLNAAACPSDAMSAHPHMVQPPRSRRRNWIGDSPKSDRMGTGQVLLEKYLVVRKLGQGGMGAVWLVKHLELDCYRALKLILSGIVEDEDMRVRFRREAKAMASFNHPNAVTIHDAGMGADFGFIEMEYVRGPSVDQLIELGKPMPLNWIYKVGTQLCEVLCEAHAKKIIHRDLKPSNLMLLGGRPAGREFLKVLDFGLAKILKEAELDITQDGFVGTVSYASPEQVMGRIIDARSDIYAVGVLLYEFLTGRRPFMGSLEQQFRDVVENPPPLPHLANPFAAIPPALESVVMRCLAKDPAHRPQSAQELGDLIEEAMQAQSQSDSSAEITAATGKTAELAALAKTSAAVAAHQPPTDQNVDAIASPHAHANGGDAHPQNPAAGEGEGKETSRKVAALSPGLKQAPPPVSSRPALNFRARPLSTVQGGEPGLRIGAIAPSDPNMDARGALLNGHDPEPTPAPAPAPDCAPLSPTPAAASESAPAAHSPSDAPAPDVSTPAPASGLAPVPYHRNGSGGTGESPTIGDPAQGPAPIPAAAPIVADSREFDQRPAETIAATPPSPSPSPTPASARPSESRKLNAPILTIALGEPRKKGEELIVVTRDNTAWIWSMADKAHADGQTTGADRLEIADADKCARALVTENGRRLILGGDGLVRILDLESGAEIVRFRENRSRISGVAFDPVRNVALCAGIDPDVWLWDATTGQALLRLSGHQGAVRGLDFNDGGRLAVTGSSDRTVRLWDLANGAELRCAVGHEGPIIAVESLPEVGMVASAAADGRIVIWDLLSGQPLRSLKGHASPVRCLSLAHDGQHLASGGGDGQVRVWEWWSGREIARLEGHEAAVTGLAWSKDGRQLATAGKDQTVNVWEIAGLSTSKLHAHSVPIVIRQPLAAAANRLKDFALLKFGWRKR